MLRLATLGLEGRKACAQALRAQRFRLTALGGRLDLGSRKPPESLAFRYRVTLYAKGYLRLDEPFAYNVTLLTPRNSRAFSSLIFCLLFWLRYWIVVSFSCRWKYHLLATGPRTGPLRRVT
jgi:hypothetical protein